MDAAEGLTRLKQGERDYPRQPDAAILETFGNPAPERDYWITFETDEFTSLCPITGQPDFARVTIAYIPDRYCVESKSLKLYLFAYRSEGAFYEAVINRLFADLSSVCRPRRLIVTGAFSARGGIRSRVRVDSAAGA